MSRGVPLRTQIEELTAKNDSIQMHFKLLQEELDDTRDDLSIAKTANNLLKFQLQAVLEKAAYLQGWANEPEEEPDE